ncbi:uncharacterized protein [Elaeis guineensis]|uniref:uncharacterized protein isoform X2 n=1 Tax=Elaeis guineensis var. tenera TaxID=51953 RepID=UPI00057AAABB
MTMASSSSFWASAGPPVSSTASASSSVLPIKSLSSSSRTILSWSLQNRYLANTIIQRSDRQAVLAFANANARQRKGSSSNEVMMVDPLEAKRLAAKQMQQIRAKEKLKFQFRDDVKLKPLMEHGQ